MSIKISGGVKVPQGRFSVYTPPPPQGKELWAWGNSYAGQTGHGDTVSRSSPVQVGSLTDWANVEAGGSHSLALKSFT